MYLCGQRASVLLCAQPVNTRCWEIQPDTVCDLCTFTCNSAHIAVWLIRVSREWTDVGYKCFWRFGCASLVITQDVIVHDIQWKIKITSNEDTDRMRSDSLYCLGSALSELTGIIWVASIDRVVFAARNRLLKPQTINMTNNIFSCNHANWNKCP